MLTSTDLIRYELPAETQNTTGKSGEVASAVVLQSLIDGKEQRRNNRKNKKKSTKPGESALPLDDAAVLKAMLPQNNWEEEFERLEAQRRLNTSTNNAKEKLTMKIVAGAASWGVQRRRGRAGGTNKTATRDDHGGREFRLSAAIPHSRPLHLDRSDSSEVRE
eukprot:g7863.t1